VETIKILFILSLPDIEASKTDGRFLIPYLRVPESWTGQLHSSAKHYNIFIKEIVTIGNIFDLKYAEFKVLFRVSPDVFNEEIKVPDC
jgi:hypothetical protein